MLSRKHYQIILSLIESNDYVTSDDLANDLDVSNRTIKRYIDNLNHYLKDKNVCIESSKGLGYKIIGTSSSIYQLKEETKDMLCGYVLDDSMVGRIQKVIRFLINYDFITIEMLSEKLNLSLSSVNKMMGSVRETLKKYNLNLHSKPHYGTGIVGSELDLRALILDYGIKRYSNNKLKVYLNNINTNEIEIIERIVSKHLSNLNIILSDNDFNKLVEILLVSISRNRINKMINKTDIVENFNNENYYVVYEIMTDIEKEMNLTFSDYEYEYISFYSGFMLYNYSIKDSTSFTNLNNDVVKFVFDILNEIHLITGNNFRDDFQFINSITVHINLLLNRIKINNRVRNPMIKQIKSRYPVEMNLASFMSKRLSDFFNVTLSEDEIGFLAMHFGASRERKNCNDKIKIAVLCHYGIGTAQLLAEKIKKCIFKAEVIGVFPVRCLDLVQEKDIDCIISTQNLDEHKIKLPIMVIEDILSDAAIKKINKYINLEKNKKDTLLKMFHPKAFYKFKAANKDEVIKILSAKMIQNDLIDNDIMLSVLERENQSSTDIGNLVAIPHTTLNGIHKSVIGVAILDEPIIWDKDKVQIVFMICFNLAEIKNIQIFKYMYNIIEDINVVESLIKSDDFVKFKQILNEEKLMWIQ